VATNRPQIANTLEIDCGFNVVISFSMLLIVAIKVVEEVGKHLQMNLAITIVA
jgi:hypothetical protein